MEHILIHEMIEDHNERMLNLRKYYPFFQLMNTNFSTYKEGRYEVLDMAYLTMAVIRYFIHENNFNDQDVSYEEYATFLSSVLQRDFSLLLEIEEEKELIRYIFEKLFHDGKPFEFSYFDPKDKKRKLARVKLFESDVKEGRILYHLTKEAVEFYLYTKEMKEESKISVQQLLLEKMIRTNNFKGGIEVVRRMNNEVKKISYEKRDVVKLLSEDIFEGVKAYDAYVENVAGWFAQEQKLFKKNQELVKKALEKAELKEETSYDVDKYQQALNDISALEVELKKTIYRHSELMRESVELTASIDGMIKAAKLRKLRPVFDFKKAEAMAKKEDTPRILGELLSPFWLPNKQKRFSFDLLNEGLYFKPKEEKKREKIVKVTDTENYVFEDEIEEERISNNFEKLLGELFRQLMKKDKLTLREYNAILEIKFGKEIYQNGDYYSFLVHLCQKKEYHVDKLLLASETFLEGMVSGMMKQKMGKEYKGLKFTLHFLEEEITLNGAFKVTDMIFERI